MGSIIALTPRTSSARGARWWFRLGPRLLAAILCFGAEGIHLSILPDQVQIWWGHAVFFLVIAMAQGLLGVALLFNDPGAWTLRLGIIVNIAAILAWAFTRIGGIPIRNLFVPLPAEDVDLAATLIELGLIGLLVFLSVTRQSRAVSPRPQVAH